MCTSGKLAVICFVLGVDQKKIMQKMKITHVLAIHDAAEAQWPDVSAAVIAMQPG